MIDKEVLAERISAVDRHLQRVHACLPEREVDFTPASDAYNGRKAVVEVIVQPNNKSEEKRYTEKDVWPVSGMMDEKALCAKFETNAKGILSSQMIEDALGTVLSLEKVENIARLMGLFSRKAAA